MRLSFRVVFACGLLLLLVLIAGHEYGRRAARKAAHAAAEPTPVAPHAVATRLDPPLVGATYMGGNWPKNFINAFRRENVAGDFARLRADGFNTVVLLVAWGDFQPVFDPCCRYDERAFERLGFLIERAREAGLDVALRVGYEWSFHPDAGEIGLRTYRLFNEARVREAFLAFAARVGDVARKHANVRLTFLSWEDLWFHAIDPAAKADFRRFLDSLPADSPWRGSADAGKPMPKQDGADAALFNAYWDWLLMHELFAPAATRLPALTFEARIDRESLPSVDAAGKTTFSWVGHETTYDPPGADVISLYWAPFWGAKNEGEQLDAREALHLLGALLTDVRAHSGALPMFVDQLNVIDNTIGAERNATLKPSALPAFMDGALCTMRQAGVFGYAYWTTQDIAESPLYNPAFSYGLEGWNLTTSDGAAPQDRLQAKTSGDFDLALHAGDELQQTIPRRHGRLPVRSDDGLLSPQVCVLGHASEPAEVEANAGDTPVRLQFPAGPARKVCSAIATRPTDAGVELRVRALSGTLNLTGVMLFDHIQEGGLYHFDGSDGVLLPLLRKFNQRFVRSAGVDNECNGEMHGDGQ